MRTTDWEARKSDQRTAKDADQTEFLAMKSGSCNLEEGMRDDRTADAMDDFGSLDSSTAEFWAVEDSKFDDAVGATASEVERRATLMGDAYPFVKEGNSLKYNRSHTLTYELCLAISNAPNVTTHPYISLQIAFERLCRDVVSAFLGPATASLRTGMPLDEHDTRGSDFKSVVELMHAATGEWIWRPSPGRPDDPTYCDAKDMGIDFVAWKQIPDKRKGTLFLMGQCACGHDWTEKFDDLDIEKLERDWFRRLSTAAPCRVFCVPHHISNATFFDEANQDAGLVFDRARLALLAEAEANRPAIVTGAPKPFVDLVKLVVTGFEAVERAPSLPRQKGAAAPRSRSRVHVAPRTQP